MKRDFSYRLGAFFIFFCHSLLTAAVQDAITLEVGVRTQVFHDAMQEKILITEVFYPAEDGVNGEKTTINIFDRLREARDAPILQTKKKYPLIVVSHGQKGDRFSLTWLNHVLAGYGYIVASIDHFGSTWATNNPEAAIKRWTRTQDVSTLITSMLKDPVFGPHIDENKIGMIGYSLGSLTGLWLAGGVATQYQKPDLMKKNTIELEEGLTEEMIRHLDLGEAKKSHADPRIKAFVLLSPVYGSSFDRTGLYAIKVPILMIAGENDKLAPVSDNALLFQQWIPASSLKILGKNSGHGIFLSSEDGGVSIEDRIELNKTIVKEILKFFDQTLQDQSLISH